MLAASQVAWFVSRASGIMAWVLATTAILWGLALSTKLIRRRGVPAYQNYDGGFRVCFSLGR